MSMWIDLESDWLRRRRRLRKTLIWVFKNPVKTLLSLLLTLLVAGLLLRPVLMPRYVEWKTERDLGKAREAAAAGNFDEARSWAQQVLRAERGGEEEALQMLLNAQIELGDPSVVNIAGLIWHRHPDMDPQVRLLAWQTLGERFPTAALLGTWMQIEEDRRFQPDMLRPILQRCADEANPGLSREILAMLPLPLDPELESLRLAILANSPLQQDRDDFVRELVADTFRHPDHAATWLGWLERVEFEQLGSREFEQVMRFLGGFPNDHLDADLQRARLRMKAEPAKADTIFLETYRRHSTDQPWATARWCRAVGRDRWARETLDLGTPASDPDQLELQVELLLADGRREDAASLLDQVVGERIGSWRQGLWKVWATTLREGSKPRADALLEAVEFVTGSPDPSAAIQLARAADRRGFADLARDAWALAFAEGIGPLPLYDSVAGLLPALERAGQERAMLAVGSRVLDFEPGNLSVRINHAYLSLTNGLVDPGEVLDDFQPVLDQQPGLLPLRNTLALAHLLEGRPTQAAALTDSDELDWFAAPAGTRALRIAILRESNRIEEAEILAQGFRLQGLLPSEQRIFRALLEDRIPGLDKLPDDPALRAPTPATAKVPEPDEETDEPPGENPPNEQGPENGQMPEPAPEPDSSPGP